MSTLSPIYITVNVFCAILGLLIIIINAVTIFLIFRKCRNWENTLCFIANLAVADGLTGFLILANVVYNLNSHQIFYECLFRLSAVNSVIFASVFILLGVTCDRYIKIIFPMRYTKLLNEFAVKIYLCIVWTISTINVVIPFMLWIHGGARGGAPVNLCSYFIVLKKQYLLSFCITIFCEMLLQLSMYCHIFAVAVSQNRRSEAMTTGQQSSHRAVINHIIKPSRTILTMVGINFLTMIPVGIYVYLVSTNHLDYMDHNSQGDTLVYVATPLYLNSFINPFLYAFKIPDIRRTLSKYLPWLKNRVEPQMTTCHPTQVSVIQMK